MNTSRRITLATLIAIALFSCDSVAPPPPPQSHNTLQLQTIDEAEKELMDFIQSYDSICASRGVQSATRTIKSRQKLSDGSLSRSIINTLNVKSLKKVLYLFNFDNDMGYAIIPANKDYPSPLAFNPRGFLDPDDEIDNPGMAVFLDDTDQSMDDNTLAPNVSTQDNFISGDFGSSPIVEYSPWETILQTDLNCQVRWGQREPYNNRCPVIDGKPTFAGCVATATAQLMAMHEHPTAIDGYQLDWSEIKISERPVTQNGKEQVAYLFEVLGKKSNLNMDYGVETSGADSHNIPRTMKNFGYNSADDSV